MRHQRSMLRRARLALPLSVVLLVLSAFAPSGAGTQASSGGAGAWAPTGSMSTVRLNDTATLLPSGQVLVVGGDAGPTSLASAEVYNPATGTWAATGSLNTGRYSQSATLLPNGQVLVAGGWSCVNNNCTILASAELYNPATGTWTPTGSMTQPRFGHTATLLPSGQVLVAGGCCAPMSSNGMTSAELYNPATGAWTATGSLATARLNQTATLLPSGQVLVAGGAAYFCVSVLGGDNPCLAPGFGLVSAEVYDPQTGLWSPTGSMTTPRTEHTATLLPTGQVLVVAGTRPAGCGCTPSSVSAELYDPTTGTWALTANSPVGVQAGQTTTLLPTGQVLMAGGWAPSPACAPIGSSCNSPTPMAALYDPRSATWTSIPSMSTARSEATATLLESGQVLVAGGGDATSEVYTPIPLTVSTSTLHVAQTVTVTGTAFTAGEPVALYWDSSATAPLTTTTAPPDGSVVTRISVPQTVAGRHTLIAVGQTSATAAFAYVHVAPLLFSVPHAGVAGSQSFVLGAGFGAHEPVTLYWDKPVQALGTATSTTLGSVGMTITIPLSATSGLHLIYAIGQTTHAVTAGVFMVQ